MVGRPCSSLSSAGGISLRVNAREVKTKFSKTSIVDCFPIGDGVEGIVIDWITRVEGNARRRRCPSLPTTPFKPWIGRHSIELEFLTTAAPVRQVLRKAAAAAGVPYFTPHAIRSTVAKPCDEGPLLCGI